MRFPGALSTLRSVLVLAQCLHNERADLSRYRPNDIGWQAHSVRGFLSGTLGKKMGLKLDSAKRDGERVYSISR